jgi:hypothetical protein
MKQVQCFFISISLLSIILFSSFSSTVPLTSNASAFVVPNCSVTVTPTATPSKITIKGEQLTRANPDGTYYPGDAFEFQIQVSWTRWCITIYPHGIIGDGLTLGGIQRGPTTCDDQGDCGFVEYGHAEIGISTYGASLHQVVGAYGYLCDWIPDQGGTCHMGTTSGYGVYTPTIIKPKVYIKLRFENFTDRDRFKMRNTDGTYYVWDGINTIFNPDYKWKDARFRTLDTKTVSRSDISQIGFYECHERNCPHTFSVPAIKPWSYSFGYEEGHAAFNSTSLGDIHRHTFYYHTDLYNLGRKIGEGDNSTTALVVRYKPVYTSYGYTILKDNHWWGFGNRPGVALHYLGSMGGGPDDQGEIIHKLRRSKINAFSYTSYAYRVLTEIPLNDTMSWSESRPANFVDENFTYQDDSLQPGNKMAMFVKSGYGEIIFAHPILGTILKTRYDNSTIINTLQSANFAGYDTTNVTKYTYGYPHTRFNNDVIVLALHSDGTINHIPLSITMTPDFTENATYEQDFIRTKVTHDMDRIIAGIVLGDMYGKDNHANGTGVINFQVHMTSLLIPDVYRVFAQNPLDLQLNVVYEQIGPYVITITAGQQQKTDTVRGFEFDTNWKYVINMDQDNVLNATRHGGVVMISPDENFGPYTQVMADGMIQNTTCTDGCAITLHDKTKNYTISAYNTWGGKASKTLSVEISGNDEKFDYGKYVTLALSLILVFMACMIIRRYGRTIAALVGFGEDREQ